MYDAPEEFVFCGDLFRLIPILVTELDGFLPLAEMDEGPALLIDADCAICKPTSGTFNFAPLHSLTDAVPNPGMQGDVRRYRVRRFFYLEAHPELDNLEWVADLQSIVSVQRDVFDSSVDESLGPSEQRIRLGRSPFSERVLRLNLESRRRLREHIGRFFDLSPEIE